MPWLNSLALWSALGITCHSSGGMESVWCVSETILGLDRVTLVKTQLSSPGTSCVTSDTPGFSQVPHTRQTHPSVLVYWWTRGANISQLLHFRLWLNSMPCLQIKQDWYKKKKMLDPVLFICSVRGISHDLELSQVPLISLFNKLPTQENPSLLVMNLT